jgi:hypothetical protein
VVTEQQMTLDDFVAALMALPELTLMGGRANFHFKGRRFIHLHDEEGGSSHADLWLGERREEFPMNTDSERLLVLALAVEHLEAHSRHRRPRRRSRS